MQPRLVVSGQKELLRKLAKFGEEAETRIAGITQIVAEEIKEDASSRATQISTQIARNINTSKVNSLLWKVNVNFVPIAAYVEFGTGAFVQVAPEWRELAYAFYKNGQGYLPPRPYLYPAWKKGGADYKDYLFNLLKRLTEKYNRS